MIPTLQTAELGREIYPKPQKQRQEQSLRFFTKQREGETTGTNVTFPTKEHFLNVRAQGTYHK